MKICIIVLLLVVMAFQSANKAIVLTSFYINKEYIEQNVCINRFEKIPICKGQCYLKSELNKTDEQNNKLPSIKYKEVQLYFDEISLFEKRDTFDQRILEKATFAYKESLIPPLYFTIFHPPQLS